ncbi:MAG: hypothetical protein KAQ69_12985 [Spirochaetales bacterium]|nr:hypothetical protein [Spirochaetales bacterium]
MRIKDYLQKLKKTSPWSLAGFLLGASGFGLGFSVSPWFLLMSAVACFIFPLLRFMGLLQDWDEFQTQSSRKAAIVSYTITGLFIFYMIIMGRTGLIDWDANSVLMNLLPIVMMSYYLTYFFQFWDGLKAGRIISGFILFFWGLFIIMSSFSGDHGFIAFIMEFLAVLLPLIAALVLSFYYPLFSGIFMLGVCVFHFIFFKSYREPSVAFMLPVPELIIGLGYIKHFRSQKQ